MNDCGKIERWRREKEKNRERERERDIYIYIWLVPRHLPTFLGLNPFTTCVWPKKGPFFFYTNLCETKNRVLTLHMKKKGSGPHFAAIFQKNDPKPLVL